MLAQVSVMSLCLSVWLSHAGVVSKRLNGSCSFFDTEAVLLLCGNPFKGIRRISTISVFLSGISPPKLWTRGEKKLHDTSTVAGGCRKQLTVVSLLLTTLGDDKVAGRCCQHLPTTVAC